MRLTLGRTQALACWIGLTLLCTFAPEAVAGAFQATIMQVCGAAVALGLAIIKEANGNPK
ncbi:MAG TPA: hypothetical protein VHZ53_19800 [Steroidobacteraceae bacterium]|jgi:hypothetical protein|nr:hypothetical protein [Steroidobacteraceae bacterium]